MVALEDLYDDPHLKDVAFFGEYEHTIDDKSRLTLPARFRDALADGVVLTRGLDDCLDVFARMLAEARFDPDRQSIGLEIELNLTEETGDPELELQGAGWTIIDLMELGDIEGVDIQIAAASKLAEALHRPIWLWWTSLFRAARAQLAGDFDEAERLARKFFCHERRV